MRSLIALCLVAGTFFSTAAQASVETCAQTLLQSPNSALYANLQVTSAQAQQIAFIRSSANQQRAELQAQLTGPVDTDQDALLGQQLASVDATAETSVVNLLTEWQQSQCDDQAMVAPGPVVVTVPAPYPVYGPVIVRRPVLPRYPVVLPPLVRRPGGYPMPGPIVRRPGGYPGPAPVMHRPVAYPSAGHRPTAVAHAPSPTFHPSAGGRHR